LRHAQTAASASTGGPLCTSSRRWICAARAREGRQRSSAPAPGGATSSPASASAAIRPAITSPVGWKRPPPMWRTAAISSRSLRARSLATPTSARSSTLLGDDQPSEPMAAAPGGSRELDQPY